MSVNIAKVGNTGVYSEFELKATDGTTHKFKTVAEALGAINKGNFIPADPDVLKYDDTSGTRISLGKDSGNGPVTIANVANATE